MNIIGILTENFRVYYDLIKALKEEDIPFVSLSFSEPIPSNVGVILTTREEMARVNFVHKLAADPNIQLAIHLAKKVLSGKETYRRLTIGIDPGPRPGIAVIGDETVLHTAHAETPEDVLRIIEVAVLMYPADSVRVKIGSGGGFTRDRIIQALKPLKLNISMVSESGTTRFPRSRDTDVKSAISIAFAEKYVSFEARPVVPKKGELRNIQRLSRLESGGRVTISKKLAAAVAQGRLTLSDAVEAQKRKSAVIK